MPYVDELHRDSAITDHTGHFITIDMGVVSTPGILNYTMSYLMNQYLKAQGESYTTYNTLIGVLECAKLELYRTQTAEYENIKRELNGDVYGG